MRTSNWRNVIFHLLSYGNWIAGGGSEYMSIYERMKTDLIKDRNHNGNGECLTFQINIGHMWSDCNSYHHSLCISEAIVQIASKNFTTFIEWRHYVQTCFENGCFPITYNDTMSLSISQAYGPSWTNVIRSDVIYKYNGEMIF
ncbi:uncharacterized protein LOC132742131 [Ruditapes philippinarum]|uniref:uncharacterized protein LOC132742131 n=1 Tax=Ruditapes philippinarum TaxID=129788 RepID=UPI00295B58BD|nr:uncharacterized protein LOC132742131 [Ruditapes philippinarum]